jgi:hypothetical protein
MEKPGLGKIKWDGDDSEVGFDRHPRRENATTLSRQPRNRSSLQRTGASGLLNSTREPIARGFSDCNSLTDWALATHLRELKL